MRGSETPIEFSHRTPPRPRLLTGLGLGLLSGVCWTGAVTPLTIAVSLCLAALAMILVRSGFPRREVLRLDTVAGTLTTKTARLEVSRIDRIELRAESGDLLGRARTSYSAEAVQSDGARVELLETGDPTELIRFARAIGNELSLVVAWDAEAPRFDQWTVPVRLEPPLERLVRGHAFARRRKASIMTWIVALGLGITWAFFVLRAERPPSAFSLSLAAISLLFVLLTASLVTFEATLVTVGPRIHIERRVVGIAVRSVSLDAADVLRACALAPDGEGGHLLLITRTGALAEPLAEPATHRVQELISGRG